VVDRAQRVPVATLAASGVRAARPLRSEGSWPAEGRLPAVRCRPANVHWRTVRLVRGRDGACRAWPDLAHPPHRRASQPWSILNDVATEGSRPGEDVTAGLDPDSSRYEASSHVMIKITGTESSVATKITSRAKITPRSYRMANVKTFCAVGSAAITVTARRS
jgi:hypothetical protein